MPCPRTRLHLRAGLEDPQKARELLVEGLDTYRSGAAFSLRLSRTDNLAGRHVERGKALEKALDWEAWGRCVRRRAVGFRTG